VTSNREEFAAEFVQGNACCFQQQHRVARSASWMAMLDQPGQPMMIASWRVIRGAGFSGWCSS